MIQALEKQKESQKKGKPLRDALPAAAALMDEIRAVWGQAWADDALREGLRLQREHARMVTEHGTLQADRWLDAQKPSGPSIVLLESDQSIGALPGRRPLGMVSAIRPTRKPRP